MHMGRRSSMELCTFPNIRRWLTCQGPSFLQSPAPLSRTEAGLHSGPDQQSLPFETVSIGDNRA